MMAVLSGRVDRKVFVSVAAYQPGRSNSDSALGRDLMSTLSDFSLTASVGWPSAAPVGAAR